MKEWIRNHEEVAMMSAFVFGLFVGFLMHD